MYWAQAVSDQSTDPALAAKFKPIAAALSDNEDKIMTELNSVQGPPQDIGGYYKPDVARATKIMRPSATFNAIIDGI